MLLKSPSLDTSVSLIILTFSHYFVMRAAFHIDLWDAHAYARLAIVFNAKISYYSFISSLTRATTNAQKRETFFAHSFRRQHHHGILWKRAINFSIFTILWWKDLCDHHQHNMFHCVPFFMMLSNHRAFIKNWKAFI